MLAFSKTKGLFAFAILYSCIPNAHPQPDYIDEQPCRDVEANVDLDFGWFASVKVWYYPLMSQINLYQSVDDVYFGAGDKLREDQIFYEFCPRFWTENGNWVISGFGNRKLTYITKPISPFTIEMTPDIPEAKPTVSTVTLTDNKTFTFFVNCYDNKMSWGIMSTLEVLPTETKQLIHEHALSLGFSRKQFLSLRYDTCPPEDEQAAGRLKSQL